MYSFYHLYTGATLCYYMYFEFQVVNGPEVLSKFVGETEKNVRDLFADAENDQKTRGMIAISESS